MHPTIEDFILLIVNFLEAHPGLTMADIDQRKTGLRGAYTLMPFKASNCMKFDIELVGGSQSYSYVVYSVDPQHRLPSKL